MLPVVSDILMPRSFILYYVMSPCFSVKRTNFSSAASFEATDVVLSRM